MITKEHNSTSDQRAAGFAGALLVGIVVGLLVGRSMMGSGASDDAGETHPAASRGPFGDSPEPPAAPVDLGPPLEIEFSAEASAVLEAARQRALREGVIRQLPGDEVQVVVRAGGQVAKGRARLKGDWLDHVETDKWSLRIQLDEGHVFGMSELSIQHPQTRGYYMEWLVLEIGRREGLLAPRCRFVDVSINGKRSGIYYLEEHFTKEMLESQGRRDGPIARLLEDSLWATWRQFDFSEAGDPVAAAGRVCGALVLDAACRLRREAARQGGSSQRSPPCRDSPNSRHPGADARLDRQRAGHVATDPHPAARRAARTAGAQHRRRLRRGSIWSVARALHAVPFCARSVVAPVALLPRSHPRSARADLVRHRLDHGRCVRRFADDAHRARTLHAESALSARGVSVAWALCAVRDLGRLAARTRTRPASLRRGDDE